MKRNILIMLMMCSLTVTAQVQKYPMSRLFNDSIYNLLPFELPTRGGKIPSEASMKRYCPLPKEQEGATCVAWAAAYAARTILEAINKDWTNTKK